MYSRTTYITKSVGVIKLIYFLMYAAAAAWTTYFYVFLENERNLTGIQIGSLAAAQQITNLVFLPLWGMISDRVGKRKVFLMLLGCSIFLLYGFLVKGNFLYYLGFVIFFSAIQNPIGALVDSFAIHKTKEKIINTSYGEMRLWASIGWAVTSVSTGLLVKYTSIEFIFPLASFLLAITWIISYLFLSKKLDVKSAVSPSFSAIKNLLLDNKKLLFFFLFIMAYYIFNSPTLMFINLYYNEMGASNLEIGIAFALQSVFELPFMFYGARIIHRYGIRRIILFTMIIAAVRMALYGFISDPWIAIAVGSLHGITLGLFLIAAIEYTHRIVPESQNSTGQSLLYTFLGLGTSIGNFINGILKDTISLQHAMKVQAILVLLLVIVALMFSKNKKFYNK